MKYSEKHLLWFILIAISIVAIIIIYGFNIYSCFGNWKDSGTFGDSYGALNSLFSGLAFTAVIITIILQKKELEHQQIELRLQRDEMKETRNEFQLNRITNIIYRQLERYEYAVRSFVIEVEGKSLTGNQAFLYLHTLPTLRLNPTVLDIKPEEYLKEKKQSNSVALEVYVRNDEAITNYAVSAYNSIKVLEEILVRSHLSYDEMNELKNMFFRNIGFFQLTVIEDIINMINEYNEISKNDDTYFVDLKRLTQTLIFLKPFIEFRKTIYNEEKIEEIRGNWIPKFGEYA